MRVRATPGCRSASRIICSSAATSGTRTFTTKDSSPATNQQSSTSGTLAQVASTLVGVGLVGQEDPDQRAHRVAERLGRDGGVVAGDHAAGFELADPFVHGRRRQPDDARELGIGRAAVRAQGVEQLAIDGVH